MNSTSPLHTVTLNKKTHKVDLEKHRLGTRRKIGGSCLPVSSMILEVLFLYHAIFFLFQSRPIVLYR